MLRMEQIAVKIAAAGIAVAGQNLFVHRMPETCTEGLVVLARLTGEGIDWDLPTYRRDTFQVIARSASPLTVESLLRQVTEAISITNWTSLPAAGLATGPVKVMFIRARHEPIIFPRSDAELYEGSMNYEFACNA